MNRPSSILTILLISFLFIYSSALAQQKELSPFEIEGYLKQNPEIMDKYGRAGQTTTKSGIDAAPGAKTTSTGKATQTLEQRMDEIPKVSPYLLDKLMPPEELTVFGEQLFAGGPTSFTPQPNLPVTADYLVGPDDNIVIHVWGGLNATYYLTVKRDGTIQVPVAGSINVGGLSFRQLEEHIKKKYESVPGTNVSVTMGPLRSINVFVVGAVKQPGAYTVSAFDTILSALIYAGGPEIKSNREDWYKEQLKKEDVTTKQLIARLEGKIRDRKLADTESRDVKTGLPATKKILEQPFYQSKDANIVKEKYSNLRQLVELLKQEKQSEELLRRFKNLNAEQMEQEIENLESLAEKKDKYLNLKNTVEGFKTGLEIEVQSRRLSALDLKQLDDELKRMEKLEADREREKDYTLKQYSYPLEKYREVRDKDVLLSSLLGSMRKIQLKRQNQVVSTFDLYELILKGDSSKDTRLQAGDIIFVPKPEAVVAIYGDVKVPAVYEIKEHTTLIEALELAGGIKPSAYAGRIQVQRYADNKQRIILDVSLDNLKKRAQPFNLQNGDFVRIQEVIKEDVNAVFLFGNVKRPGKYQYRDGLRITDMFRDLNDLKANTYFPYGVIKRHQLPDRSTQLISVRLGEALLEKKAEANIALQPYDELYIFSEWDFKTRPVLTISGEVRNPGAYPFDRDMRIRDAIFKAGGLTQDAYLGPVHIFRTDPDSKKVQMLMFDLSKAMNGANNEDNPVLQDKDRLVVHSVKEYSYDKKVSIDGDVLKPGDYPLAEGMTVRDLVFAAGNLKESAYVYAAELSRIDTFGGRLTKVEVKNFELGKAMNSDPAENYELRPYDRVFVKRIPDWQEERFVSLSGEVMFPGKYILKKGERLSSIIERAGGYTPEAYLRGAFFTRDRVRTLQQRGIEEMAARLERDLMAQTSSTVTTSLSVEEVQAKRVEAEQRQKFIESLRKLKASGRMTIHLAQVRLIKGSDYDIEMEDGDSLSIPERNSVVNVNGAVMAQGSLIYSDKMNYEDYIMMAGGYADYADKSNVFVIKVDGSARKIGSGTVNWNRGNERWELAYFGERPKEIEAGDIIVVPEKTDRIAWLREFRDITQILMNTAVIAGVVIKLF